MRLTIDFRIDKAFDKLGDAGCQIDYAQQIMTRKPYTPDDHEELKATLETIMTEYERAHWRLTAVVNELKKEVPTD